MNDETAPSPPPASEAPPAGDVAGTTKDEQTMAMLAHLLGIFLGFLGPLIIWLIKKDESDFVEDQAREALNFQITVLIALFAAGLSIFAVIGCVLTPGVVVANIVFCILAAMTANDGRTYRYPLTLRLIK